MNLFIPIIIGTGRQGAYSVLVASAIFDYLKNDDRFKTELFSVTDFELAFTESSSDREKWKQLIDKSDGLIIVSPEYNHGYPGELKLLLDLAYKEYNKKPLGVCGVSSSFLGGARMVEQLRLIAIELQMIPVRNAVYFSDIKKRAQEKYNLTEEDKFRLEKMLSELIWYSENLKSARLKFS